VDVGVAVAVGVGVGGGGVGVSVGVEVGVAVAVAVGVAVAVAVGVAVGIAVGVAAGLGVAVGAAQLSLPMVINVPGEFWLLYSVVIQLWERAPAATWTSSIAPLYRVSPCWPDMSKSAVERIEAVRVSNCVVVAFAIPSS